MASVAPSQGAVAAVYAITFEGIKFGQDTLHTGLGDTARLNFQNCRKHTCHAKRHGLERFHREIDGDLLLEAHGRIDRHGRRRHYH